jgi:hypothetical protein
MSERQMIFSLCYPESSEDPGRLRCRQCTKTFDANGSVASGLLFYVVLTRLQVNQHQEPLQGASPGRLDRSLPSRKSSAFRSLGIGRRGHERVAGFTGGNRVGEWQSPVFF